MAAPTTAYKSPVEVVRDFVEKLSLHPPDTARHRLDLTDVVLYPTGRCPPNFGDVVRALSDPEALKLFGRDLVTLDQAIEMLRCSGPALVDRAKEAGELYGLLTPYGWLFSRRRVRELRDLDIIRKWLTPAALSAVEEPS